MISTLTKEKQFHEIKSHIDLNLGKRIPIFSSFKNELINKYGHEFVKILREGFKYQLKDLKEITDFRLSLIIDNNFIFGQVKKLAERNELLESSFVYKLLCSDYVDVYAPPKLKKELYDKIETVLTVNNDLARSYVDILINKIKIEDAFFAYDHKRANDYIGDGQFCKEEDIDTKNHKKLDRDDVPYLALAFSKRTHAIISKDQVFNRQDEIRVWSINDTDSVVTTFNEGFISICCLSTLPSIGRFIWDTVSIVFFTLIDAIIELIALVAYLVQSVWKGMKKIPEEIYAIASLLFIFSETARDLAKQSGEFILNQVKELIDGVKKFIEYIISLLKEMYENLKPLGTVVLQLVSSMLLSAGIMYEEIQEIERLRVT